MLWLVGLLSLVWSLPQDRADYEVQSASERVIVDGAIADWDGVAAISLTPESAHASTGDFGADDLAITARFLWDKEYLYVALDWQDDKVDLKEVRRQDAVFLASDGRRRDRMYFYDYLKLAISEQDYNYMMWVSPKLAGEGPYSWQRLLEGYDGTETAAAAPLVAARELDGRVTIELRFTWKGLRLKGKKNETIPLALIVADSDEPEQLLNYKAAHPKWLTWRGRLRLVE